MGFFREIRSALNEIFAEFSQDVILRSKTFKCIIGENGQQEVELESDGFVPNEIFAVKFKEADWKDEAYPVIEELLQYSYRTFCMHWISTHSKRGRN